MKEAINVLISHAADLDGAGCEVVARCAVSACKVPNKEAQAIECIPVNHDKIDHVVKGVLHSKVLGNSKILSPNYDGPMLRLWIADICPSEEVCKWLQELYAVGGVFEDLYVNDHHDTSTWLEQYEWAEWSKDNTSCGTQMLLDYLVKQGWFKDTTVASVNNLILFADMVDAYDRWVLDSPIRVNSDKLNELFHFLQRKIFVREAVANPILYEDEAFMRILSILEKKRNDYIANRVREAKKGEFPIFRDRDGHNVIVLLDGQYTSALAHAVLYATISETSYVAIIHGNGVVSFRSRKGEDIDVAAKAKKFGGGGHKEAAGFKMEFDDIKLAMFKSFMLPPT